MPLRSLLASTALLIGALAIGACADGDDAGSDPARVEVRIGDLAIDAEIARTPEARSLGLGNRDSLPDGQGMLFVHPEDGYYSFWMYRMRFSLDFIWIDAGGTVVELTENVPPPAPGAETSDLEQLTPEVPVRYVLEVNARIVQEAGIAVGDEVAFEPEP